MVVCSPSRCPFLWMTNRTSAVRAFALHFPAKTRVIADKVQGGGAERSPRSGLGNVDQSRLTHGDVEASVAHSHERVAAGWDDPRDPVVGQA